MPANRSVILLTLHERFGRTITLTDACWHEKIQNKHRHPESFLEHEIPLCITDPTWINVDKDSEMRRCYYRLLRINANGRSRYLKVVVDFLQTDARLDRGENVSVYIESSAPRRETREWPDD